MESVLPKKVRRSFHLNVISLVGSNLLQTACQAAQFLILARVLGAQEFGGLALINAVVSILVPVAGLGFGNTALMRIARDAKVAPGALGNGLLVTLISGVFFVFVGSAILIGINKYSHLALLFTVLGFSELIVGRIQFVLGQGFAALELNRIFAITMGLAALSRACAAGLVATLISHPSALKYAQIYVVMVTAIAIVFFVISIRKFGRLSFRWHEIKRDIPVSAQFAAGTFFKALYTDLDKVMLGHFAGQAVVGLYTSAYRVFAIAFTPVRALLDASAARFFRTGSAGIAGALNMSKKLLPVSVGYSLISAIGLWLCAPLLPWLLGNSYAGSVEVLRLLSPLLIVQSVHYVLSDALTGSGFQSVRTKLQALIVLVYVSLGVTLIPSLGWHGAVFTCLISESLFAVAVGMVVYLINKKELRCD